ncbi:MAG: orotate phosphoribosyltransferase [Patescibacteria group bacterium]|jgi:orotate phosphoribosyltransferase|nr:orotate phosphoribosyltransferase [Patescibacteria group bacterium]
MLSDSTQKTARQAVLDANVLTKGHFVFADGSHADIKLEMDNLWSSPKNLDIVLDLLANAEGLPPADVVLGVPTGGQLLAQELVRSGRVKAPIAMLERIPGGKKQDFRFVSKEDEQLVMQANSIVIYEDVVTTLSSIAGVVKLLKPLKQDIHSLAIWRRGEVKSKYHQGIKDHYLVEEILPQYVASVCKNTKCRNK